jgi:hypothetical protein
MQAVRKVGVADEMDYQKQERLRELMRDLENTVINGVAAAVTPQGSSSIRRSMNGIIRFIQTNRFTPNVNGVPSGGGTGTDLNEAVLNYCLKQVWENSSARLDTIVVGGALKRRINQFIPTLARFYTPTDQHMGERVGVYESDFGSCRVILSRWMPADSLLMLDSSRIEVLPLAGRSMQYRPLAQIGDSLQGQIVGEYTLEFRNELAHGLIRGLT